MYLYRIAKTKYVRDLSGERCDPSEVSSDWERAPRQGARRVGGRWNKKGSAVLYTADSTALAILETLVHSPLHIVPKNRSILTLDLPDDIDIERVELEQLPDTWWNYPAPVELAELGDLWLQAEKTLALSVPSSVTPQGEGRNILLNPFHPDFSRIKIVSESEFAYDSRLFQ